MYTVEQARIRREEIQGRLIELEARLEKMPLSPDNRRVLETRIHELRMEQSRLLRHQMETEELE